MNRSDVPSHGRRRFFGALGFGVAAVATALKNPFSLLSAKHSNRPADERAAVTITPNPMAVERTQKGAAQHG